MPATNTTKKRELIFVLAGKQTALVDAECDKLLDKLIEPSERVTGLFKVDPAEVTVSQVLDELRTLPFLTNKRVVLIRGADKFVSANRPVLEKYFDNPSPTGIFVLTVNTWDARTKLAKKLPAAGRLINVIQPKRGQLPQRLVQYSRDAHGKNLGRDTAFLLVELAGEDMPRLYSEIDKLALLADSERTITSAHVESLVGHNRLFNAFNVIDACLAGNPGRAVSRLRNMFAEDRSTEFTVVGAFAFHFRRMFNAKALLEKGMGTGQVAKQLGIWNNSEGFFSQVRRMPLKKIGELLQGLAEMDYAIKTGRTKPQVAVERLVLRLATA